MFKEFLSELSRNFSELKKYKFNLIFANLGILLMLYFLVSYLFIDNKEVVFLLLIIWYFATHGLATPTYIIEDEITDRTIINIIQSKTGILSVVVRRSLITFLIDIVKVIPLFSILFIIGGLKLKSFNYIFLSFLIIILASYIVYALGTLVSSFGLVYKRVSGLTSLTYYYILFFGGITVDIQNTFILAINKIIFPFQNARILFEGFQNGIIQFNLIYLLLIQAFIFTLLVKIVFEYNIKKSLKRGTLYGI